MSKNIMYKLEKYLLSKGFIIKMSENKVKWYSFIYGDYEYVVSLLDENEYVVVDIEFETDNKIYKIATEYVVDKLSQLIFLVSMTYKSPIFDYKILY